MVKKTAIITGASSGIGEEFAKNLASKGYDLVLIAKDRENLLRVGKNLKNIFKADVGVITADLSSEKDLEMLEKKLNNIDAYMLVNNAGFGLGMDFASTEEKDMLAIMKVHMEATTRLTKAVLPKMIEKDEGVIINVSSVASFLRNKKNSVLYNSTKTYILAFSECLQQELWGQDKNIKIQCLCPGFTNTNFHTNRKVQGRDFNAAPSWVRMDAEDVVKRSLKALKKRKTLYVPGFMNKLTVFFARNILLSWIPNKVMERNVKK